MSRTVLDRQKEVVNSQTIGRSVLSYYNILVFTDPVKNLKAFQLEENNIVADLGAGTGFYSIAAAQMVPRGKVYAVEVQKDFVKTVSNKAKEAHVSNIEALWGDIEKVGGTNIKDGTVDAVIVSNVLFQVEHRDQFIEEAKRIMKPGGKLLLIDWTAGVSVMGPNAKDFMPKKSAQEMFEKKGFVHDRDIDAGVQHYGMIFKKQAN